MGDTKEILIKNHYFHVLTITLRRKFHADFKNCLKKFHTISEGSEFLIEVSLEMTIQNFKSVWQSWPKFEQVTKKVPTPLTLEPLDFD